jgi:hypothetical protein
MMMQAKKKDYDDIRLRVININFQGLDTSSFNGVSTIITRFLVQHTHCLKKFLSFKKRSNV